MLSYQTARFMRHIVVAVVAIGFSSQALAIEYTDEFQKECLAPSKLKKHVDSADYVFAAAYTGHLNNGHPTFQVRMVWKGDLKKGAIISYSKMLPPLYNLDLSHPGESYLFFSSRATPAGVDSDRLLSLRNATCRPPQKIDRVEPRPADSTDVLLRSLKSLTSSN